MEASPLVMMRLDEFIEGLDGLQMNELVLQRFWIDIVTFGQLVGKLSLLKTTPDYIYIGSHLGQEGKASGKRLVLIDCELPNGIGNHTILIYR